MKYFILLLIVSCSNNDPCNMICDKTEVYTTIEYDIVLKMPITKVYTRCILGHYIQNPKSKWKCAGIQ